MHNVLTRLVLIAALIGTFATAPLAAGQPPAPEQLIALLRGRPHPYLLFRDIRETPGWKNRDREPWRGWLQLCSDPGQWSAEVAVETLGMCSSGAYSEERSGERAMMWAMAHQLTGDKQALARSLDLLNHAAERASARAEKGGDGRVLGRLLIGFALAYDWVQPQLSSSDDQAVREQLALLADSVAARYATWGNAHDRIIAGAGLGVAALALADYSGATSTRPADWLRHATTYLFVNDSPRFQWPAGLHVDTVGRSALLGTLDPGGFNSLGSYSVYWIAQLSAWLAVYRHALGRNPLDDFPLARRILDQPLWESMPNRMDSQQGTRDHQYYSWYKGILQLLGPEERGGYAWYAASSAADTLRARRTYGDLGPILLFLLYDDSLSQRAPQWTSFISPAAEAAILRGGWQWDSDWLFLKVMNYPGPSERHMLHDDNLSFELYSRGDYLLADGGEIKYRLAGYGPQYACGHNSLLIDGVGPVKEDVGKAPYEFLNSARLTDYALGRELEFAEAEMRITHVESQPTWDKYENRSDNARPLSSPVTWRRTILYPGREYFLLVDHVEATEKHNYEFLFHFSSLNIEPTQSEAKPGHVRGDLKIGTFAVDWAKDVAADPLSTRKPRRSLGRFPPGELRWTTRNPDGRPVELRVVSSLQHDRISIGRAFGRVAQVKTPPPFDPVHMEVDHPYASLEHSGEAVRAIMALLPRYTDGEAERKVSRLQVRGPGSALKLQIRNVIDLVATGEGRLGFDQASTDASLSMLRLQNGRVRTAWLLRGHELRYGNQLLISSRDAIEHALVHFAQGRTEAHVSVGQPTVLIVRVVSPPKSVRYRPDYGDMAFALADESARQRPFQALRFRQQGNTVLIDCPAGAGELVIE